MKLRNSHLQVVYLLLLKDAVHYSLVRVLFPLMDEAMETIVYFYNEIKLILKKMGDIVEHS